MVAGLLFLFYNTYETCLGRLTRSHSIYIEGFWGIVRIPCVYFVLTFFLIVGRTVCLSAASFVVNNTLESVSRRVFPWISTAVGICGLFCF